MLDSKPTWHFFQCPVTGLKMRLVDQNWIFLEIEEIEGSQVFSTSFPEEYLKIIF